MGRAAIGDARVVTIGRHQELRTKDRTKDQERRTKDRWFLDVIYAAIFDMDGVLVDSYHAHYESWRMLAAEEGIDFPERDFARTFGRTSREIIRLMWAGRHVNEARVRALDGRKELLYRQIIARNFPAMPGATALLRELQQAGFRLAVGSSGPPENVEAVLEHLGRAQASDDKAEGSDGKAKASPYIVAGNAGAAGDKAAAPDGRAKALRDGSPHTGPLFDAVVTGMDVVRGKPDPQVFLLAAERMHVPPDRSVVIEDAAPGIEAANRAGMASVALVATGRTEKEFLPVRPSRIVRSLTELTPRGLAELIERHQRAPLS